MLGFRVRGSVSVYRTCRLRGATVAGTVADGFSRMRIRRHDIDVRGEDDVKASEFVSADSV